MGFASIEEAWGDSFNTYTPRKKYNKSNGEFEKTLKQKTYDAIDKYKQAFKFITLDKEEPAKDV